MKDKDIFVVIGKTGEYSDACEWLVAAYKDLADAEAHAKAAEKRAAEIFLALPTSYSGHSQRGANQYDPAMVLDYTGTKYRVEAVCLQRSFP